MIYGDTFNIAVQLELVAIYCDTIKYGAFNFIIEEQFVSGGLTCIELHNAIKELKDSLIHGLEHEMPDLGNVAFEKIDFSTETRHSIIDLGGGHLFDQGFSCELGFDGNEDRFFYTADYEKTFHEKRYPRGTIEKLILSLPTMDELEFCSKDMIRLYGYISSTPDKKYKDSMPAVTGSNGGELDGFGNEWLACQHLHGDEKPESDVILSTKWRKKMCWPKKEFEILALRSILEVAEIETGKQIGFYQEVEIITGENLEQEYMGYVGRKGIVLGISKEDGVVYGYGIYFRDSEEDEFLTFTTDEVVPTGRRFKREEFYDGSYACVSPIGEIWSLYVAGARNQPNFYSRQQS